MQVLVAAGDIEKPRLVRTFAHPSIWHEEWASQLRALSKFLENELGLSKPGVVLVRTIGHFGGRGGLPEWARRQLQAEGVILEAAASASVSVAEAIQPQGIGQAFGSTKDQAEDAAERAFGAEYREVGATALAALAQAVGA